MPVAQERGLTLEVVTGMSDDELECAIYGSAEAPLHTERRRPGVTLALLHEEYLKAHADGYRYTQFCDLYRA